MHVVLLPIGQVGGGRRKEFRKGIVREKPCTKASAPRQTTEIALRTNPNAPQHVIRHGLGRDSRFRCLGNQIDLVIELGVELTSDGGRMNGTDVNTERRIFNMQTCPQLTDKAFG